MEVYSPSANDVRAYRHIMLQHGSGYDNDGYYVYSQDGEGIGSFLGSLFKFQLLIIMHNNYKINLEMKKYTQR